MLDNLRAMAVFACVVERHSFSSAARELGITTSAVSQQIRALEQEMGGILLHRSTRKLSLTEAGQIFLQSCQELVAAAERGRVRISELRDDLVGNLRIATTPELGVNYLVPALSEWLSLHTHLKVYFEVDHRYIDLIEGRIDIAIRMSSQLDDSSLVARPMGTIYQVLAASPDYLSRYPAVTHPTDLLNHQLLPVDLMQNYGNFAFVHNQSGEAVQVQMASRLHTNSVHMAKALAVAGHGIVRVLHVDVKDEIERGELIPVLTDWRLPEYCLYAVTLKRDQQPLKIVRCLDALKHHFAQIDMLELMNRLRTYEKNYYAKF